jgi:hypothetical protein
MKSITQKLQALVKQKNTQTVVYEKGRRRSKSGSTGTSFDDYAPSSSGHED